jgi:hypothetical protein
MVNNTIAVTPAISAPAKPPRAEDVRFYWNTSGKTPAAWVTPPQAKHDAKDRRKNDPENATGKDADATRDATWYWPTGGAVAWSPDGAVQHARLGVFLFEVGRKAAGGGGVWNFESRGGAVAIVKNPHDAVEQWRVTTHVLPYALKQSAADESGERSRQRKRPAAISWGMAAFADARAMTDDATMTNDPTIYLYGRRERAAKDGMVLARVAAAKLAQLDAWEYFAGEQGREKKWSRDAADATAIATGVTSEFSVEPIEIAGKRRYVMIQSEPLLGKRIFARWANAPTGPWSDAKPFYTVRDVERHKSFFTYAAKGHVALSRPGELLVTYLVNAHDFGAGFRDAEIYRPRFLRVPMEAISENK